ncbi:hypothetical protein PVAND_010085 [Polypedilum vanderplanki]|uniref:Protease inhibitor n=1 Tax=Polypedilum vanderplanki TaxID=319348 RepID=A0A9J6CES3_POLVA|nr:hypothetical protein PVAND_010085 [Polypedilum vanderplanki]
MKLLIFLISVFLISHFYCFFAAPCTEEESTPWLEVVEVEQNCTKGEKIKYKCKDECICDGNSKAKCPKWVKCCNKGEVWSTNGCNKCYCTDDYKKICEAMLECLPSE